jgi:hypothetical protein
MSFAVLETKLNGLRHGFNCLELKTLEKEFREISKGSSRIAQQSKSIRNALFVDLAYALMRHRDWLQVPVFSSLLTEFLQFDYKIPRGEADLVCHDMIEAVINLGLFRQRSICCDDREFLTWAYVCAAGSRDEDSLDGDLGLGTAVLRKLRDGLQAIDRVDHQIFIPEYDAMLATIVIELGHECKSVQWAMDLHRLRYALLGVAGDAAQPFILEEQLPDLLALLFRLGSGEDISICDRPALSEILAAAGIIRERSVRRRRNSTSYELGDQGYELTAHYAALHLAPEKIEHEFMRFGNRWQEAIIRSAPALSLQLVKELMRQHVNRLSPEVLEAMVARVVDLSCLKIDVQEISEMLATAGLGWHKAAILRGLGLVHPSQDLIQVIVSELDARPSPAVRLAANGLLEQWANH